MGKERKGRKEEEVEAKERSITQSDSRLRRGSAGIENPGNTIAREIVDAAYHVHRQTGPGLLESAYESMLAYELESRGLRVDRQAILPVSYHDLQLEAGYRIDLLVENRVIVELKSVDALLPVHQKQLLTYLRLSNKRLGLLINFGESLIKNGIHRMFNGLPG